MTTRSAALALALTLSASLCAAPASAQVKASEHASVEQTVDGTTVSLEYYRPRARGRELFGAQVKWNEPWTPGANVATRLRTNRPVRINGHELQPGAYSVWFLPRPDSAWSIMLDRDTTRYHTQKPRPDSVMLRFQVTPQYAQHVEVLTWLFPDVSHDAMTMLFAWGTVRLPVEIAVTPSRTMHISAADAAPYVGAYNMDFRFNPDRPQNGTFIVRYQPADSTLRADAFIGNATQPWPMILAPASGGVFTPVYAGQHGILEAQQGLFIEFDSTATPATVQWRDERDRSTADGTRSTDAATER